MWPLIVESVTKVDSVSPSHTDHLARETQLAFSWRTLMCVSSGISHAQQQQEHAYTKRINMRLFFKKHSCALRASSLSVTRRHFTRFTWFSWLAWLGWISTFRRLSCR